MGYGGKRRVSSFPGQELLSGVLVDRDWRVTVEVLECLATGTVVPLREISAPFSKFARNNFPYSRLGYKYVI